MKVICKELNKGLSLNKPYDVLEVNSVFIKGNHINDVSITYKIRNDLGCELIYNSNDFLLIEEWRESQLYKIIK